MFLKHQWNDKKTPMWQCNTGVPTSDREVVQQPWPRNPHKVAIILYQVPGEQRITEDYRGLLAGQDVKQGGKESCWFWQPRHAPTVDFMENKKNHTNVWVNTCSQAHLVDFWQRFFIITFDIQISKRWTINNDYVLLLKFQKKIFKYTYQLPKVQRNCSNRSFLSTFLFQLFERFCCLYMPLHLTLKQCVLGHNILYCTVLYCRGNMGPHCSETYCRGH